MTLVDRLRAAIEERLALAEPTTQGDWVMSGQGDDNYLPVTWGGPVAERGHGWFVGTEAPADPYVASELRRADARHIVANQPSAVIARCKADLWILHELADPSHCEDCTNGPDMAGTVHECPVDGVKRTVIRLLAEGYGITEEEA